MSEPFMAEIRTVAFDFAPVGWAKCDGQLLPINQYQSLYSLLGITFGGDGVTEFGLPDLRGRASMHAGTGRGLTPRERGQMGGVSVVKLQIDEMLEHDHLAGLTSLRADSRVATTGDPTGNYLADTGAGNIYTNKADYVFLGATAGGGQPHENRQPYLGINFIIALQGLYPPRS